MSPSTQIGLCLLLGSFNLACQKQATIQPADPPSEQARYVSGPGPAFPQATEVENTTKTSASNSDEDYEDSIFMSSISLQVGPDVRDKAASAKSDSELQTELALSWKQKSLDPLTRERFPHIEADESQQRFQMKHMIESLDTNAPKAAETSASFIIDFDENSVKKLLRENKKLKGAKAWEKLVNEFISKKTYARGFDIASQVAQSAAGDCTEHAVLLTALLRANKIPARVVIGTVIVFTAGSPLAGGHAWVEYSDGKAWRKLDAALYQKSQQAINSPAPTDDSTQSIGMAQSGSPRSSTIRRIYLPRFIITSEDVGYSRAMLNQMSNPMSQIKVDISSTRFVGGTPSAEDEATSQSN